LTSLSIAEVFGALDARTDLGHARGEAVLSYFDHLQSRLYLLCLLWLFSLQFSSVITCYGSLNLDPRDLPHPIFVREKSIITYCLDWSHLTSI
jgi:hypothetical protein